MTYLIHPDKKQYKANLHALINKSCYKGVLHVCSTPLIIF